MPLRAWLDERTISNCGTAVPFLQGHKSDFVGVTAIYDEVDQA
jgi:hypothetical protein